MPRDSPRLDGRTQPRHRRCKIYVGVLFSVRELLGCEGAKGWYRDLRIAIISLSFHRPAYAPERCRPDHQTQLGPSVRIFLPTDVRHGLRQFRRIAL